MKLYYHKTSGGAEYLTDKFIKGFKGQKEGIFEGANIIVRIDGDIRKDAEISVSSVMAAAPDLLEALKNLVSDLAEAHADEVTHKHYGERPAGKCTYCQAIKNAKKVIAKAEGK